MPITTPFACCSFTLLLYLPVDNGCRSALGKQKLNKFSIDTQCDFFAGFDRPLFNKASIIALSSNSDLKNSVSRIPAIGIKEHSTAFLNESVPYLPLKL